MDRSVTTNTSTSNSFLRCGLFGRRQSKNQSLDQRDIELDDEFQFATTTCCLSSYYNVFVVRLSIMVLLAILIGILTILTWHFTKVYTTRSLNSLAYGLRRQLLQRPLVRMWSVFNSTAEITTTQVKLSEYVFKTYSTRPQQQVELYDMMKDLTWTLFASRKALNAITINYKNGFVQAFHRDHRSNNAFYIYSNLVNHDESITGNLSTITWYREPLDPTSGERIGMPSQIPPDDLIHIAGPSQVPDGVASWHVSVSKFTDSPLLSAALPVWDDPDGSNRSIVAVVGVTTALYGVSQLMKELDVGFYSGYMYLTSQEGYLLATSTNAPLLRNSSKGLPELVKAVESDDYVIREAAQWLQNAYPNKFHSNHHEEVHVENAMIRKQRFYVDSFFLNLERLPMGGVIIIPRESIMGKVDERALTTLIILISVSVCILIIGCICVFILTTGVSKEMKLRAALIRQLDARRRAEASSSFKSQFLANMSHELRTPMAAVIGLLDILLCDECLSNEQYSMITQIRKCSTALLRLLNNILDLSKVESGKLALEVADFDLGRELEGLIDMFSVQCINHNVEIVLDLSDDMPTLVRGDSARVVQIFANLISNSIKFTSSGHIILRGWCEESSKNARERDKTSVLWFEVEDTGCGIDPSKWETVFESFEQADPSTTRKHGGTGLGLCIVKTLVNKMGGEIKVVKKDGHGTLMRFYLLLNPSSDNPIRHNQDFAKDNLVVLLALGGSMKLGRRIISEWLRAKGVLCWETSEWNQFTQSLKELALQMASNEQKWSRNARFIIVVDVGLLDLSTSIWKEQLNYLETYSRQAKFAWILNHNTPSWVKMELRQKGHFLMVNKPMCKAKMTQIMEVVIRDVRGFESHKCCEIVVHNNSCNGITSLQNSTLGNEKARLGGLRILLAEDNLVLQKVATIMLEKLGATVIVVCDGVQAVNALKCTRVQDHDQIQTWNSLCLDLVLMDCQMPNMDGYEATREIRKLEEGTCSHIPIVALTAHAMTADEAKCLKVGMDGYLTKPIDCKLMVSTILSVTREKTS